MITIALKPHCGKEKSVEKLLNKCSVDASSKNFKVRSELNEETEERIFYVEVDKSDELRYVIEVFHKMNQGNEESFDIKMSDFIMDSDDVEVQNLIHHCQAKSTQYDVEIIDAIISEMSRDQQIVEKRLASIEEYLKSSGIVYYQSFIEQLLDVLDAKDILDKDFTKDKMFSTFH